VQEIEHSAVCNDEMNDVMKKARYDYAASDSERGPREEMG
jgi:hypothetical protein